MALWKSQHEEERLEEMKIKEKLLEKEKEKERKKMIENEKLNKEKVLFIILLMRLT